MKSFLQIVTQDILRKYGINLSNICVVFPNKRASLFMNQHLIDIVGHPMFSPQYMTLNELFRSKSPLIVADTTKSIFTLYRVYQHFIPSSETIDDFWGWGEVLLSDFDDIDKHLGKVETILSNVRDLHAYDSTDYLCEEDKKLLSRFFAEFSTDHDTLLKQRFQQLWNNLLPIYQEFNTQMTKQNLAYEGMLYRQVALSANNLDWEHTHYIFVGFNMLWESEKQLFLALKHKGIAHFYWDYDRYYTSTTMQEAGSYIRQWQDLFPNELDPTDTTIYDNFSQEKDITFLSASSENIQARYVGEWLKENHRMAQGETSAIVLADESLLKSVIHYLPEEVSGKANISIGYPLQETPVASFVDNFLRLHIYNFNASDKSYFLPQVKTLLSHPYAHLLLANDSAISRLLTNVHTITISSSDLCVDEATSLLFSPIDSENGQSINILLTRLLDLLQLIGRASEHSRGDAPATYDEQMMQESVFQMFTKLNNLHRILSTEDLVLAPRTLRRLIDQMVGSTTMPFHGEPIAELQITGMLETRNLDFDHLLIISCNEGNIPRGLLTPSLLPYVVRHAHALSTPETKVAVYAYNFYRLLQRCKDISLAFNSSTEDGQTGEMSRFMLQLMAETDQQQFHLSQRNLDARQLPLPVGTVQMEKTPEMMDILGSFERLSPSDINKYLRCPMAFYYQKVAGVSEPDSDSIDDNRLFGTLFHQVVEQLYGDMSNNPQKEITAQAIDSLLDEKNHETIHHVVDSVFSNTLLDGKSHHFDGLQLINREVISDLVVQLLKSDRSRTPFRVVGAETHISGDITYELTGQEHTLQVGGIIDRLDQAATSEGQPFLRVVDYKTGSNVQKVLPNVSAVFQDENIDKHSDYYLQAMLYSVLVRRSEQFADLPVQPALFFVQKRKSLEDPVLKFGSGNNAVPITDIADYEEEFLQELQRVVADIFNPDVPFVQTAKDDRCKWCAYASLCGKVIENK